jgi:hypothetical protein
MSPLCCVIPCVNLFPEEYYLVKCFRTQYRFLIITAIFRYIHFNYLEMGFCVLAVRSVHLLCSLVL